MDDLQHSDFAAFEGLQSEGVALVRVFFDGQRVTFQPVSIEPGVSRNIKEIRVFKGEILAGSEVKANITAPAPELPKEEKPGASREWEIRKASDPKPNFFDYNKYPVDAIPEGQSLLCSCGMVYKNSRLDAEAHAKVEGHTLTLVDAVTMIPVEAPMLKPGISESEAKSLAEESAPKKGKRVKPKEGST